MKATLQVSCETIINRPPAVVWSILKDSTQLPRWLPNVSHTDILTPGSDHTDEVRECQVSLVGKQGQLVERRIDFVPEQKIAYQVEHETFGMQQLLTDLGYLMYLENMRNDSTRVRLEYHYRGRGIWGWFLNHLFIRPQWKTLCGDMLVGLKQFSETIRESKSSA